MNHVEPTEPWPTRQRDWRDEAYEKNTMNIYLDLENAKFVSQGRPQPVGEVAGVLTEVLTTKSEASDTKFEIRASIRMGRPPSGWEWAARAITPSSGGAGVHSPNWVPLIPGCSIGHTVAEGLPKAKNLAVSQVPDVCRLVQRIMVCDETEAFRYGVNVPIPMGKDPNQTPLPSMWLRHYYYQPGGTGSKDNLPRNEAPSPRLQEFTDFMLRDITKAWPFFPKDPDPFWNLDLGTPWIKSAMAMADNHAGDCAMYSFASNRPTKGFTWKTPPRIWFYDEVDTSAQDTIDRAADDLRDLQRYELESNELRTKLKRLTERRREVKSKITAIHDRRDAQQGALYSAFLAGAYGELLRDGEVIIGCDVQQDCVTFTRFVMDARSGV